MNQWVQEFPAEVVVCDTKGVITEMNGEAEKLFSKEGGSGLMGTNVLDCHPEPSRAKLECLMANQASNAYFNTEEGDKRFFFQAPWKIDGKYAGFVEISFSAPEEILNFKGG